MPTIFKDKFNNFHNWNLYGDGTQGTFDIVSQKAVLTRSGNGWNAFGMQANHPRKIKVGHQIDFEVKRGAGSWYALFQLKDVIGIDPESGALRASITFAAADGGVRLYITLADGSYGGSVALTDTDTYNVRMVLDSGGKFHLYIKKTTDSTYTDCGQTDIGGYDNKFIYPTFSIHSNGAVMTLDNFQWANDSTYTEEVLSIRKVRIFGVVTDLEELE